MDFEALFRVGISGLYLVVVLDVVVAWALLRVFSPVSRNNSMLAAWFRLAYALVFMVAISQPAGIPELLSPKDYAAAFTAGQLSAQAMLKVDAFDDIWQAGLILFGIHLCLIGHLAFASGYVPRLLGVLVAIAAIAGGGYVFDSLVTVFVEGSPVGIATVTFIGELLLCLWLLIRGRRIAIRLALTPAG